MRRGWLIGIVCFLIACSEPPLPGTATPAAVVGEVTEDTPRTDEPTSEENTTFLPAIEIAGEDEEGDAEVSAESTPAPTPVPISPRPEIITEESAETVEEAVGSEQDLAEPTTYTIQQGDILGFIARDFGIPVADLMAANGVTDPNHIEAGQVLVIPLGTDVVENIEEAVEEAPATPVEETPAETIEPTAEADVADAPTTDEEDAPETVQPAESETLPQTYVVQPGDSLGKIAERFGIPLSELAANNGLSVTSFVFVDQVLIISADSSPTTETYIIQSGDTLRIIADRFGITIDALAAANNITNPNTIFVGQLLTIPNP